MLDEKEYERRRASVLNKLYGLQEDNEPGITSAELRSNMRMDKEEFLWLMQTMADTEGVIEVLPKPRGTKGRGRPSDLVTNPKLLRGPETTAEIIGDYVPQPTEHDNPLYLIEKQRRTGKTRFSLSGEDAVLAVVDRIVRYGTRPFTKEKLMASMDVIIPAHVYDLVWDRFTTPFCEETQLGNGFVLDGDTLRQRKRKEVHREYNILTSGQLAIEQAFTHKMGQMKNPYLLTNGHDEADYERIKSKLAKDAERVGTCPAILHHSKLPKIAGQPAERRKKADEYGDGRNPDHNLFAIYDLYQNTPDSEHQEIMELVASAKMTLEESLEDYKKRNGVTEE